MPVLLLAPSDESGCNRLAEALALLRLRLPGTFLLVVSAGPPPRLEPAEDLDWVCLPAGELGALRDALARAYDVDAVLDLGADEPLEAQLDRLAPGLPFEATARPAGEGAGDGGRELLGRLAAHLARDGSPRAVLRWLGPMGTEVVQLAEKMIKFGAGPLEVRLSLAALRDDLRRPAALGGWLRASLRAPRGLTFRVVSASQQAWVAVGLSALNRLLALGLRGLR